MTLRVRLRRWISPIAPQVVATTLLAAVLLPVSAGSRSPDQGPERVTLAEFEETRSPPAPAAPAQPEDPEADAWIEGTLADLGLRERVAQLVVPWIRGGTIPRGSTEHQRLQRWIRDEGVGGLIVSRGAAEQFAPMMNSLQAMARVPLLIVSDLETGPAMRLTGGTDVPPAMALGAANDEALAFEAGRLTGAEARAAGIHMTLGPVLDVNSNPLNPIINIRSFGEAPEEVARLANAWIAGARSAGLLAAGKHFPGHGATEVDSHVGLPVLTSDRDGIEAVDLVPFRRAVEAGINGILVGHIGVPAIDGPNAPPASMSPNVIQRLLREELGFSGLVFTDALNMGAVIRDYSVEEASIRAILAGADILLQPPGERSVIDAIVRAVESGRIPHERIEESVRRVLHAKAVAGLHVDAFAEGGAVPASHGTTARELASASVTLARDHHDLVPLRDDWRRVLHVTYARDGSRFSAREFAATLRARDREVETIRVDASSTDFRRILGRAGDFHVVVVSANLIPREYRPMALGDRFSEFVRDLTSAGIPVVAVSFGSPYLIDRFPFVSSYLLAWSDSPDAQTAAARALLGAAPITGRLPVSLPPYHAAGDGLVRLVKTP